MFRRLLDQGQAGDNIGVLLQGTKKEESARPGAGRPGSITPHTNFEAQVYVLTKEEGGRHKPFFTNYQPQFYFRTTDVTGTIQLPDGVRDVHARRQHRDDRRAWIPRRHGRRPPRHPRRRPAPSAPARLTKILK